MSQVHRLLGRDHELRQLETLFGRARNGHGGALLLAGEPGIGKTALLHAGTSDVVGMDVLRADGHEAESTIPYAALQRLLIPLRRHLAALPEWHQRALRVAAGASEGPPPDRFLVGLGVLGMLAAAGEERPVVCAVDDAHLLDSESLDALAFVARRLAADAVVVILATRDAAHVDAQLTGVPKLHVPGLDLEPAIVLLRSALPAPIDPAAAAQIAVATGGNPLALLDLATELATDADGVTRLAESTLANEPVPIGPHLEAFYMQSVRSLAAATQLWLLLAAADSTGDLALIGAAGVALGVQESASEAAESAGLVELGVEARFRHPLVRAAAYGAATGSQRRAVHAALASAASDLGLVELEAWHAAKATLGTDAPVADRLERVADLAGLRGGFSSRASVLVQAAGLTPEGNLKQARLVAAAEATLATGAAQLAGSMLEEVDADKLAPHDRARMAALRASVAMFTGDPAVRWSTANMLAAGEAAPHQDVQMQQDSLIEAFYFALPTERLALGMTLPDLGNRLRRGAELSDGAASRILRGLSALILLPYRDAVPSMREAVQTIKGLDDIGTLRYGPVSVVLTSALWDAAGMRESLERTAEVAREVGSLRLLDVTLWAMSMAELKCGTPRRAEEHLDRIRELRAAIGYDAEHVTNPALLAWSGASPDGVQRAVDHARMVGLGALHAAGTTALAAREIADGAYEVAYFRLKPFVDDPFLHVTPLEYQDFVEAAVRSGRTDVAVPLVEVLEGLADVNDSRWTRGVAARSRALVDDSEPHFQAALVALDGIGVDIELARAHLLYGEWLRRKRRRREAAKHLHVALAIFEQGRAPAFAQRAGRELEALGEVLRPLDPALPGAPELTSQEMTVARMAASGNTNAQIGATMFISANTVDYHLRKVFQKFGISSRRQLADHLESPS